MQRKGWWGRQVSTHSRPKAAGLAASFRAFKSAVSTHSRPKAAGFPFFRSFIFKTVSTHSRPKAAGHHKNFGLAYARFQHTAARRRLVQLERLYYVDY